MYACVLICILVFSYIYLCSHIYTCVFIYMLVFSYIYLCCHIYACVLIYFIKEDTHNLVGSRDAFLDKFKNYLQNKLFHSPNISGVHLLAMRKTNSDYS